MDYRSQNAALAAVVYALEHAPMALVAALRETSVLRAALIGTRLLAESFGRRRLIAAAGIVVGIVALRLAQ